MYFDPGDLQRKPPPSFQVLFVTGGHDKNAALGGSKPEIFPLSSLYFCDSCSRIVSRKDLSEDVDSYYCPHCLENMPSSEAMLCGMRCSKCWECPVCSSTLTPCIANSSSKEQTYHFACGYCRWSSKGRQEAEKPEQLITEIVSLERESQPRQRMMAMLEAFRTKAQEQQREKELAQRLRRRSSARTSFSAASLTAFAARRFSAAVGLRQNARLPSAAGLESKKGQWNVEDLEAKLFEEAERNTDLRSEAYLLAATKGSAPEPSPISSPEAKDSPSKRFSFASSGGSVEGPPVLAGLSVEDLLQSHRQDLPSSLSGCLLDELQSSIDTDTAQSQDTGACGACASQSMRLSQISYGYHGVKDAKAKDPKASQLLHGLQKGSQLEAPLQHIDAWKLLPLRKPLLTKRSRRCKLLIASEPSSDAASEKICKGLVVKPQINPCANPPFQKNSVAVNFVPRCLPWSCVEDAANAGAYELILILINPMEADVELQLDPCAFNAGEEQSSMHWKQLLSQQNVEVSTPAFSTVIPKFLDLEATQVFEEETKQLREKDDPDVILDRKLNKILVRLRFRKAGKALQKDPADQAIASCDWMFFVRMTMKFSVRFSAEEVKAHQVDVVLSLKSST